MAHSLLDCERIDCGIEQYLGSIGSIFVRFDHLTQDSGNISYGVQIGDERYFVKTAGYPDDPKPPLNHASRVELLRNAVRLSKTIDHSALPKLHNVIESPAGPLLVYQWVSGELLGTSPEKREDPACAFQRFRRLPTFTILSCIDAIFDLHNRIAAAGWIAVDFYDGCIIFAFDSDRIGIMDLDMYREGPFQNEMGRMFGSTRFMAPEEFQLGAIIDQRTNVFTMGRTALVFLSDGTLHASAFRGSRALFDVVKKACDPERSRRFDSMAAFYDAWKAAR